MFSVLPSLNKHDYEGNKKPRHQVKKSLTWMSADRITVCFPEIKTEDIWPCLALILLSQKVLAKYVGCLCLLNK